MSLVNRKAVARLASLALLPLKASSQQMPEFLAEQSRSLGEGWRGFTDVEFLANALLTLVLAAVLGAIIAYHPRYRRTADTLEEIDVPKVFIMYAVIGSIIGILVVKYGLVVGFVLFGIGGLIRFRTILQSASVTGQVIFVTLIGLACGLDLPHIAVLSTAFSFGLIYFLEARTTYRIDVRGLPKERIAAAAVAYRRTLEQQGCTVMSERKNPVKETVTFIFRVASSETPERLQEAFESNIDKSLQGAVDWEVD